MEYPTLELKEKQFLLLCDNQHGGDCLNKIKNLLESGIDVNCRDSVCKFGALVKVINSYHPNQMDVIITLLDFGADPLMQDVSGGTVFDMAKRWNRPDIVNLIKNYQDCKEQSLRLNQHITENDEMYHPMTSLF